jgi:LacI family transcriptional regulator
MAYGVLLALHRRGIRVPDDVSVIGFDDQRTSAYTIPPLTTIRQPAIDIGEAAAQATLQLLKEQPFEIPKFPAELVVRESVARYRY